MTFDVKIELINSKNPTIWRQIRVPIHATFHDLHMLIQASFGWRNSHLYSFSENGFRTLINICSPYDEEGALDATVVQIERIFFNMYDDFQFVSDNAKPLIYIYDYGDNWEHTVKVVGFDRTSHKKAAVLDGRGACPPEDVGGIHGFEDLKKFLSTGEPSEIHGESWTPWLEGCDYKNYDPEVFDLEAAKKRVSKVKV